MQQRAVTRAQVLAIGLCRWVVVGAFVAGLLSLVTRPTNAFAVIGIALTFASVGLALGPFKSPMVWSEGGLVTYQGNANRPGAQKSGRLRLLAIPACAFGAGILLLLAAAALAAR